MNVSQMHTVVTSLCPVGKDGRCYLHPPCKGSQLQAGEAVFCFMSSVGVRSPYRWSLGRCVGDRCDDCLKGGSTTKGRVDAVPGPFTSNRASRTVHFASSVLECPLRILNYVQMEDK